MIPAAPQSLFASAARRQTGFTLIELIAVMILVGIVALMVMPRLTASLGYQQLLLRDQLLQMARFAQRAALHRQQQAITLELSRPGERWLFRVRADSDRDGRADQDLRRLEPEAKPGKLWLMAPFKRAIDSATPLTLSYDPLGNLAAVDGEKAVANLYLEVAGRALCLSLSGYAYEPDNPSRCSSQ